MGSFGEASRLWGSRSPCSMRRSTERCGDGCSRSVVDAQGRDKHTLFVGASFRAERSGVEESPRLWRTIPLESTDCTQCCRFGATIEVETLRLIFRRHSRIAGRDGVGKSSRHPLSRCGVFVPGGRAADESRKRSGTARASGKRNDAATEVGRACESSTDFRRIEVPPPDGLGTDFATMHWGVRSSFAVDRPL